MSNTAIQHQLGARRQLITEIAELTGTEDSMIKSKKLSSEQAWTVYEEITGQDREPFNGRGWALKKTCKELNCLEYKSYRRDVQVGVERLEKIRNYLKKQNQS